MLGKARPKNLTHIRIGGVAEVSIRAAAEGSEIVSKSHRWWLAKLPYRFLGTRVLIRDHGIGRTLAHLITNVHWIMPEQSITQG